VANNDNPLFMQLSFFLNMNPAKLKKKTSSVRGERKKGKAVSGIVKLAKRKISSVQSLHRIELKDVQDIWKEDICVVMYLDKKKINRKYIIEKLSPLIQTHLDFFNKEKERMS